MSAERSLEGPDPSPASAPPPRSSSLPGEAVRDLQLTQTFPDGQRNPTRGYDHAQRPQRRCQPTSGRELNIGHRYRSDNQHFERIVGYLRREFLVETLQAGIQKSEFPASLVPEVAADVIISMVRGLSTTFAGRAALMKRPLQQLLLWLEGGGAGSAAKRARTWFVDPAGRTHLAPIARPHRMRTARRKG
jgi:hypothetical protein